MPSSSTDPTASVVGDDWVRPGPTRRGYRADVLLAVIVLVGMAISTLLYLMVGFYDHPAPWWVSLICVAASTLPLAARRWYPEATALVCAAAFIATQLLQVPELLVSNIALFIAIYSVGAWGTRRRWATVTRAIIVVGMFTWLTIALVAQASDPEMLARLPQAPTGVVALGLIQIVTNLLYFGGAWYFGERSWMAARARAALDSRTRELTAERERTAAQAVALERLRIARELHDVVAHHVSVMGIQAGAARRVLDRDPARAASALSSIESSARAAVDELHGLLTTLRADDHGGGADAAPSTTGIDQIPALVDELQHAGMRVRHATIGTPRPISPTTSVTAFRVAQEAATNTVKHAGAGASLDLRVRYLDDAVEIEVTDDGRASASSSPSDSGGLGLVGMRERVTAVGGTLEAGARARGGYLVRATLPTRPTDTVAAGLRSIDTARAETAPIGTGEIGTAEIGTVEIGTEEIGTEETGTVEIDTAETDTAAVDRAPTTGTEPERADGGVE